MKYAGGFASWYILSGVLPYQNLYFNFCTINLFHNKKCSFWFHQSKSNNSVLISEYNDMSHMEFLHF